MSIDWLAVPVEVGAYVTTSVQLAETASDVVQFPPVPGNVPPLNVNGAEIDVITIEFAANDPVFVTVNV
jgi:hypothetical protein